MSKTLIVYFSWGGVTRKVAQQLQKLTGADLLEITTAKKYPTSYLACVASAKLEMLQGKLPALTLPQQDLSAYDTILLGYPIWWFTAPQPVFSFLRAYDLSGKKVAIFCTSGSSPVEKGLNKVQKACGKAEFLPPLTAKGNDTLQPWLQQIGLK